jgi:protein farnesyltransferase subunit beta
VGVRSEVDVRGTYTVVSIASLLNILTPELADGVASYIARCRKRRPALS